MGKTYKFKWSGNVTEKLEKVRAAAVKDGVDFRGDETCGTFEGKISGSYSIEGGEVTVTVTKIPWYAPWSAVESGLEKFFSE